ncbi:serine hydrolase [uncultured Ilyobacter sp.]|uniref:serine hydrolase n=1 Tax=uncultured Ilyobacter sp. TaxID=544433 RepID=UPI0029F48E4B|nr:serine hydrolase [uncultured Ilyobacter sp.]
MPCPCTPPVRLLVIALLLMCTSATSVAGEGDEQVSKIADYLDAWHAAGRFSGAALVAHHGKVILKRGYGPANREWDIPNATNTRFHIGSIAKQFTTVMIFQLAADGRLKLEDKLSMHLPEYRPSIGERVTIDHLLRHTSGIPCYVRDSQPGPDGKGAFEFHGRYTREELIRRFMSADLLFEPGSQYHYSSSGHFLLACIIERVTGQSFEENLRQRILEPLGMNDTTVDTPGEILPRRAGGYVRIPGGFATPPPAYGPNLLGVGNLYSTVEDLYVWNCAMRTGNLLPKPWREKLLTVYWPDDFESHAYAVNHYSRRMSSGQILHYTGFSGSLPGFMSDVLHFPHEDLTVVLLDNTSQYNHWVIAPGIYAILTGRTVRMPHPLLSDRLADEALARGVPAAVALRERIQAESPDAYDQGSLENELNSLGYGALTAGRLDAALAVFQLNVALFPGSWNVHDSLGEAYREAGDAKRSEACCARAERVKHRESYLIERIRKQEFAEATEEIETLRRQEPDVQVFTPAQIGPLFARAFAAGEDDQALAIARIWALGNPTTPGPFFSEARVHERASRRDEAIACYRRILQLVPEGPHTARAREALARIEESTKE